MKPSTIARVCVGRALRHYRRRAGADQRTTGDLLGVDQSGYSKYERGAVPLPTHALFLIADVIGTYPYEVTHTSHILFAAAMRDPDWASNPKTVALWADEVLSHWDEED